MTIQELIDEKKDIVAKIMVDPEAEIREGATVLRVTLEDPRLIRLLEIERDLHEARTGHKVNPLVFMKILKGVSPLD